MRECQNCTNPVTRRFARVFGDNDNQVWACYECTTIRALTSGVGANP